VNGFILEILIKVILIILAMGFWHFTQKLLAKQHSNANEEIFDLIHQWTDRINLSLYNSPKASRYLLLSSSFIIDICVLFLFTYAFVGPSIEPLIGLILIFTLRQMNQFITMLPLPKRMIWKDPGFPSLFVTYGVSRDMFFSGHTALAAYTFFVLSAQFGAWGFCLGAVVLIFEASTVILLRAHWTMDVFTGIVVAHLVHYIVRDLSPILDSWMALYS
jgi:hypothetical protein